MKWISVTERLPDNMDDTLLKTEGRTKPVGGYYFTTLNGKPIFYRLTAHDGAKPLSSVTHWLDLTD